MTADALLLLFALVLLVAGAELLVRGATALSLRLGLSPLFIGLTVVGFGTSTPELTASIVAAIRDQPDIAVGNVIGSNVFNVAVILGAAAAIRPIAVRFAAIRRDVLIGIAAAATPWLTLATGGVVSRPLGVALVSGLGAYLAWSYREGRRAVAVEQTAMEAEIDSMLHIPAADGGLSTSTSIVSVVAGLVLLIAGARWFVSAATVIARVSGLSELAIGLTVVAAGTSMPELMTSAVAAVRGKSDIAIGNVLGSNVFNLLGVLGCSALVGPQAVAPQVLWLDAPVMLATSAALLPITRTGGRISRVEGAVLLLAYAVYVWILLGRGAG